MCPSMTSLCDSGKPLRVIVIEIGALARIEKKDETNLMKWFFRIIGLIFLAFAALMVWGYFISPTLTVERSLQVDAYSEEIFDYLEDLEAFNRWSPWFARDPDADYVFGAVDYGVGATVVWRARGETADESGQISSQEIIAAQAPEFVQSSLMLNGVPASTTYALSPMDDGTLIYIQFERELGGFPYIERLRKRGMEKSLGAEFDAALARLKTIVEAG